MSMISLRRDFLKQVSSSIQSLPLDPSLHSHIEAIRDAAHEWLQKEVLENLNASEVSQGQQIVTSGANVSLDATPLAGYTEADIPL